MGKERVAKRGSQKTPPSPADLAEAQALDEAVQAMIEGALGDWDLSRPLKSLNRDDLRRVAQAAIAGWVVARSRQACSQKDKNDLILRAVFAEPN